MKQVKDFDCVQMKWDIQQQLLREIDDLGEEEARRRQRERVLNNSILRPFFHTKRVGEITDKPTSKDELNSESAQFVRSASRYNR